MTIWFRTKFYGLLKIQLTTLVGKNGNYFANNIFQNSTLKISMIFPQQ